MAPVQGSEIEPGSAGEARLVSILDFGRFTTMPVIGVLSKILVKDGRTVEPGTVDQV